MEPSIEHPDDDVNGIVLDRLFHYSVFVLTQVFKEPSGQRVSVKDESLRSI
jgi:hypothetical protein